LRPPPLPTFPALIINEKDRKIESRIASEHLHLAMKVSTRHEDKGFEAFFTSEIGRDDLLVSLSDFLSQLQKEALIQSEHSLGGLGAALTVEDGDIKKKLKKYPTT
jgi:hypothetical protein